MRGENLYNSQNSKELTINGASVRVDLADGRLVPIVCYLGPAGSYSMEAAGTFMSNSGTLLYTWRHLTSNGEVVRAVKDRRFDIAVVAGENSIDGDVTESVRELVHPEDTRILGEIVMPIRHALIGYSEDQVDRVLTHPSAMGQCRLFLNQNYPEATRVEVASTSKAVEMVKDMKNAAAIASASAAKYYGVPIINSNVGDDPRNSTRFFVLGRGETKPTGDDKTTLMLTPHEDRVGLLRDYLDVFVKLDINLDKIASYPTGQMDFYSFLISIKGHEQDPNVKEALVSLRENMDTTVSVFGSYRRAPLPAGTREPGAINNNNGS